MLTILGAVPGMWWEVRYALYGRVAAHLDEERAAARRAGLPLTPDKLRATLPKVADADNAAPLYIKLKGALGDMPDDLYKFLRYRSRGRRLPTSPSVRAFLSRNTALLAEAERISRMPGCDWYTPGATLEDAYTGDALITVKLIRVFCARALMRSDAGDLDGALSDLMTASRIVNHAGTRADSAGIVFVAGYGQYIDNAFHDVVLSHCDDPHIVARARTVEVALTDCQKLDIPRAIRFQAASYFTYTDKFRKDPASFYKTASTPSHNQNTTGEDSPSDTQEKRLPTGPPRMLADAWEATGILYWLTLYQAASQHPDDSLARYRAMHLVEDQEIRVARRPCHEFLQEYAPGFHILAWYGVDVETRNHLRRTLLALIEARQRSSSRTWPVTLPAPLDSTPTERTDSCTGKPLHYAVTRDGHGFRLYSVGTNGKDDGGSMYKMIVSNGSKERTDDIVICYP